jgi:cytoskeletal protein RodZ
MSGINGGSVMSRFEWAGDNWVSEPSYNLGNVTISAPTQTTTTTPNTTQSTTVTTQSTTTKPNTTNTTQGTTTSQAKINTTNDRAYDYKLENGKYFFKGKQGTSAGTKYPNWIEATGTGLTNIKQYVKF